MRKNFFEDIDFVIVIPMICGVIVIVLMGLAIVLHVRGNEYNTKSKKESTALEFYQTSGYLYHLNNCGHLYNM